jgi:glycosyltransferase involved in cell wall biosynthesis
MLARFKSFLLNSTFDKPVVIVRNVGSLSWSDNAKVFDALQEVTDPIVFFVGLLDWKKGLHTTIQAKLMLDKQGIRTCLVLAGDVKGAAQARLYTPYPGALEDAL